MTKKVVPRHFYRTNKHFNYSNVIKVEKDSFRWTNGLEQNGSLFISIQKYLASKKLLYDQIKQKTVKANYLKLWYINIVLFFQKKI